MVMPTPDDLYQSALNPYGPVAKPGQVVQQPNVAADLAATPYRAAGMLGGMTGISDAVNALRGTMTEEEAKNFAVMAAIGSVAPELRGAGEIASQVGGDVAKGIRAYHGSPYDFNQFSLSKIGTGEGAQAYGHGLYLAENENTAKKYRDDLSPPSARYFEGDRILNGPEENAAKIIDAHNGSQKDALDYVNNTLRGGVMADPDWIDATATAINKLNPKEVRVGDIGPQGHMYEVNINADPEHFLDWDRPLSQQHPVVQGALNKAYPNMLDTVGDKTIQQAFPYGINAAATQTLRDAGIPGIRYLDQGSRGTGAGTSNYVVFDDKLVDIVKKFGLVGLIAGGAYNWTPTVDKAKPTSQSM